MNTTLPLSPLAMVIEDDEKLSIIFSEAVKQAGFTPRTIRTGDVALQDLGAFQPWLVILDLHLPHVSGETILKAIREDPRMAKTQVIITTADVTMAKLLEEQGDLVLIKPVSFTQLRDLAYRVVKTRVKVSTERSSRG